MSRIMVTIDGEAFAVEVRQDHADRSSFMAVVDGEEIPVYVPKPDEPAALDWMVVGTRPYELNFQRDLHWVQSYLGRHPLAVRDMDTRVTRAISLGGRVKAPIPGLIRRVLVAEGDTVEAGQPVIVLEAMKMENEITATRSGEVKRVAVEVGNPMVRDELLVEVV